MTIWTRIKLWVEKKEQQAWMDKYHSDQRCPKCNTWQGNCGGWKAIQKNFPTNQCDVLTCGRCNQKTTMFDVGVGYVEADSVTGCPLH